jgi:hypothetical protein
LGKGVRFEHGARIQLGIVFGERNIDDVSIFDVSDAFH